MKHRVSDIHIEPQASNVRIRFRIDGIVCDVAATEKETCQLLINQFKAMAGLDPIIRFTPRDARDPVLFCHNRAPPLTGNQTLHALHFLF